MELKITILCLHLLIAENKIMKYDKKNSILTTTVCLFFLLLINLSLNAQGPELIFHSGFEPNTHITIQGSNSGDISGIDNSVSPPNDWIEHFDNHPLIGDFTFQYEGGNDTMRLAEITVDPTNPLNNVLRFWIKHPNVDDTKGRVQANIYNNSDLNNVYYSTRLYLPSDFNLLKDVGAEIKWLTIMEFWNDAHWMGSSFPFRITVNLQKIGAAPDSLRIGAHGQAYDFATERYNQVIWDTTNTSFAVPVGKWMNIEVHFIEGDEANGRFYFAVTPENETKTVVLDINNFTHHPANPSPDGLGHFNPLKLYTSDDLINYVRDQGKLLNVYWDDFKIWKDYESTTGVSEEKSVLNDLSVYPNPFNSEVNIEFSIQQPGLVNLNIYNVLGQKVAALASDYLNVKRYNYNWNSGNLSSGIYFLRLEAENIIETPKLLLLK